MPNTQYCNECPCSAKVKYPHKRVRVWWPPTNDPQRTGYAAAWWPARVIAAYANAKWLEVEYDNGDIEMVQQALTSPIDVPVAFGGEPQRLYVGDFCEVSNDSASDPCAWVGRVKTVFKPREDGNRNYMVEWPFHDDEPEKVGHDKLRLAYVYKRDAWHVVAPKQTWNAGDVISVTSLNLLPWPLEDT